MESGTELRITADVPESQIADITRRLALDLSRNGVAARSVEAKNQPGDRGDAVTLGQLALAALTGGAATALINCLKAYISQVRSLTAKITLPDGTKIEISGKNVDSAAVRDMLRLAKSK